MANPGYLSPENWWTSARRPAPLAWRALFTELTIGASAEQWGLAAGLYIIHHHRRHDEGPTIRDVFSHLFPDTNGLPSLSAEDWARKDLNLARHRFWTAVIVVWRRLGYVQHEVGVPNSLHAGRRVLALVARDERIGAMAGEPASADSDAITRAAMKASLTPEQAVIRLRTSRRYLDRVTRAGFLHAVALAPNEMRYPMWQFSAGEGKPVVDGVSLIVSSIPSDWTLPRIHRFFTTPTWHLKSNRRSQTPTRWLSQGRDPLHVAILLEGYQYDIS